MLRHVLYATVLHALQQLQHLLKRITQQQNLCVLRTTAAQAGRAMLQCAAPTPCCLIPYVILTACANIIAPNILRSQPPRASLAAVAALQTSHIVLPNRAYLRLAAAAAVAGTTCTSG
jgi:hypothetical protein